MITVTEAKNIIREGISPLAPKDLPLTKAAGLTLAKDIFASTDIPNFRQSSMDGYAILYEAGRSEFVLVAEIPAGSSSHIQLLQGQAARIFTGAALPEGADTVVMQEKVTVENDRILIGTEGLLPFQNVRQKGAEIKRNALAMQAGTILTPAALGYLAGIGISDVSVIPNPSVCIILTGNELQDPGNPLEFGQVYEANSVMLKAAWRQVGVTTVSLLRAEDDLKVLQDVLNQALQEADMVLLTGGVSVGDYDFVVAAAKNCGVKQAFHKIKQRPGKPLFFGTKYQKVVFGLPGNPSSVLSCFYQYVLPAIGCMTSRNLKLQDIEAVLSHNYPKSAGLTHFLKGHYDLSGKVCALHAQESFRLHSFAEANCLIVLEENRSDYAAGDLVQIHLLPTS